MATLSALRVMLIAVVALYVLSYHASCGANALATGPPGRTLRVDLVRRDSLLSPLLDGQKLSIAERLHRAIERSHIRRSRLQHLASHSFNSYYSPISAADGDFVMQMGIGSPVPLNLHFILDTGSDLIWTQCEPCGNSCVSQNDPIYDPFKSSSYTNISCSNQICAALNLSAPDACDVLGNCMYNYVYADSSYTNGVLGYERFSLATTGFPTRTASLNLAFGCGRDQGGDNSSSDPFSYSAGIIGLVSGPLSLITQTGTSIFSYCLGSIYDDSEMSSFFLGPPPTYGALVRVTPLQATPYGYYLSLLGISVAGKKLPIPNDMFQLLPNGDGGLLIDSGTTITMLVDPVYKLLLSAVKFNIQAHPTNSTDYDLCYDATSHLRLPTITFHFAGGAKYVMPQNNSFVSDGALLCLAFQTAGPPGSLSIFGNFQQQNFHIVYDLGHNQLSFAHTKCAAAR